MCSREENVLTVPEADNTLNRVDRVVLQFDTSENITAIKLKTGTPAVAAQPPDILQNHNQYELGLCTISVPAGSTAVTAADITDTRADETVCGVMRDGVTGIPTAQLQTQVKAMLDSLQLRWRKTAEEPPKAEDADPRSATVLTVQTGIGFVTAWEWHIVADFPEEFPVWIYQSTDPTSPAALFGGSWEVIASERVLMGASSTHAAGTTVKAGLPNITGTLSDVMGSFYAYPSGSGAFSVKGIGRSLENGSSGNYGNISFDASKSNAIYGRSSTVQPAAYYVHIWHRVA